MWPHLTNKRFFNLGAWAYDRLTAQDVWRDVIAAAIDRVTDQASVRRVVDLGCGPGVSSFVIARRLPHAHVLGIDIAERMIQRARAMQTKHFPNADIDFQVADATSLGLDDASCDLAIGHSFLYLVPDRASVLAEVRRVLAPGGVLVLMEPNRDGSLPSAARKAPSRMPKDARPGDVARFAISMFLWRVVSARAGQLSAPQVRAMFIGAGFARVDVFPTLAGLGLHCVGYV